MGVKLALKSCKCGCGGTTKRRRDFIHNHDKRKSSVDWIAQERGFETPCLTWQLGKNKWGYGAINLNGSTRMAHRVLYEKKFGSLPNDVLLDHKCRNRDCVNIDHLEPVSAAINIRRGDQTKLTEEQVISIRRSYSAGGISQMALSKIFDVSRSNIMHIVNGKTWREVGAGGVLSEAF